MSHFLSKFRNTCFWKRNSSYFEVFYRNYPAPRKRFYQKVHITECDGKYEICLDNRKLKTPSGKLFQVYNEGLAVAVATEWDIQQNILQQQNMHLTSLCNTALDNPCRQTKDDLADAILQFLSSDTLCYRLNDPPEFALLQKENWDPPLTWFQNRYFVKLGISQDVSSIPVPDETLTEIKRHLLSYNHWCLIGMHFAAENLKSLVLTFAVINHKVDVETAVSLSRLETLFQIKRWGNVEWSHDVDKVQTTSRVAAAALFVYLNEGLSNYAEKTVFKKISSIESSM